MIAAAPAAAAPAATTPTAIFEPVRDGELGLADIFFRSDADGCLDAVDFRAAGFAADFFGADCFTEEEDFREDPAFLTGAIARFTVFAAGLRAGDFELFFAATGFAFGFEAFGFGRADERGFEVLLFSFAIGVVAQKMNSWPFLKWMSQNNPKPERILLFTVV